MANHPNRNQAARFARAWNAEEMNVCDAIARAVTGSDDARGGLRPHQRWDRDAKITVAQAQQFLRSL